MVKERCAEQLPQDMCGCRHCPLVPLTGVAGPEAHGLPPRGVTLSVFLSSLLTRVSLHSLLKASQGFASYILN